MSITLLCQTLTLFFSIPKIEVSKNLGGCNSPTDFYGPVILFFHVIALEMSPKFELLHKIRIKQKINPCTVPLHLHVLVVYRVPPHILFFQITAKQTTNKGALTTRFCHV